MRGSRLWKKRLTCSYHQHLRACSSSTFPKHHLVQRKCRHPPVLPSAFLTIGNVLVAERKTQNPNRAATDLWLSVVTVSKLDSSFRLSSISSRICLGNEKPLWLHAGLYRSVWVPRDRFIFFSFLKMCSGKLDLFPIFSPLFLFPFHGALLLLLLNEAHELHLIAKDGALKLVKSGKGETNPII